MLHKFLSNFDKLESFKFFKNEFNEDIPHNQDFSDWAIIKLNQRYEKMNQFEYWMSGKPSFAALNNE